MLFADCIYTYFLKSINLVAISCPEWSKRCYITMLELVGGMMGDNIVFSSLPRLDLARLRWALHPLVRVWRCMLRQVAITSSKRGSLTCTLSFLLYLVCWSCRVRRPLNFLFYKKSTFLVWDLSVSINLTSVIPPCYHKDNWSAQLRKVSCAHIF